MISDTPRTDNHMELREEFEGCDPDFTRTLERELNTLRWIHITERLPTIEDGDQFEDVEWSCGKETWQGNYKNSHKHSPTHWRRITLP